MYHTIRCASETQYSLLSQITLILKLFSDLSATNNVHHMGWEADYVKIKVDVLPVIDVNNPDVHKTQQQVQ